LFSGEGTYHGRFHDFENVTVDPVMEDPPRLLAGGSSVYTDGSMPEPVLDRIVTAGGWIAPPLSPEQAAEDWATIRSHAESNGVNPDSIDRVALTYCYVVDTDDCAVAHNEQRNAFGEFYSPQRGFESARESCLTGSVGHIHEQLQTYADAGFGEVIVGTPAHDPSELSEQINLLSELVLNTWH
jgi:alkanesulfonate monooxygenase SsuD/methylene tetrahydromethanopterin reductase-like flavin-dependent oxidoreductase (luciferase family)